MENLIIILIILCIVTAISVFLYKCNKQGQKCIGCPYSKKCGSKCSCKCRNDNYIASHKK